MSTRAIPDPHVVALRTHVNGEKLQDGTADQMIFDISKYVSPFS